MGNNAAELSVALLEKMPNPDEIYTYNLDLPEFVIVGENGEQIPGTSSSMIRYYICKYIKADETDKPIFREKIKK